MKKLLHIISGLVLLVSTVHADSISTIQLQNRPAEEVIPIVKPMLGPNDAISGQAYQVFLRSSPATLARVREMIEVIDTPSKVLQVSVFQGSARDLGELGIAASVQLVRGDTNVEIGGGGSDGDDAGGSVTYSTDDSSATVGAISTQKSLRDTPIHQVRVTEGTEAYIETGLEVPFFTGAWVGPAGVAGGVEYRNATTGFYVLPRVRGDDVVLEISPFRNSAGETGGGNINTQSASTTLSGRVGEWILIGGVTEQIDRTDGDIGGRIVTQSREDTSIWIRADLVQ
jgi:type II secretory pathway component GspD/PulD (secretin)